MFQTFTDHLIKSKQIISGNTFTVWRISDDNRLFLWLFKLLERLQLQHDVFRYTGSFYIMSRNLISFRIVVVSVNLMSKFALLTVIIVNLIEHIRIEIYPFLKSKPFTEYSRSDILSNQCRFNRDSTRTTHRVDQITFSAPSGH